MSDTFLPRLVNNPFEDPALFVAFRHARSAFLFDLGRIDSLSLREIHKVTDVLVTHMHINHFIGFDHLLRSSLNREVELRLYGPRGITDNVRGKLAGYTWNLIENYSLNITVREIDEDQAIITQFRAADRFQASGERRLRFDGVLLEDPSFTVRAAILDHQIPCLGIRLEEKTRLNVRPDRMEAMGLVSGPWLDELKRLVRQGAPVNTPIEAPARNGEKKRLSLKEWRDNLIVETEGQKVAYVVDNIFSPENTKQILSLAHNADLFYCEAAFAHKDEGKARERYHLTSTQAGELARIAQAKRFIPFHFSRRYEREPNLLLDEALKAFAQA